MFNSRMEKNVVYSLQWNIHSNEDEKKTELHLKMWMNLTNMILGKTIQKQKRTNSVKIKKDKIYLCC